MEGGCDGEAGWREGVMERLDDGRCGGEVGWREGVMERLDDGRCGGEVGWREGVMRGWMEEVEWRGCGREVG